MQLMTRRALFISPYREELGGGSGGVGGGGIEEGDDQRNGTGAGAGTGDLGGGGLPLPGFGSVNGAADTLPSPAPVSR